MADGELNPQQLLFLKNYDDPKSPYFGNAFKSAVAAGYREEYAKNILSQNLTWLSENLERRKRIMNKAENRLETLLDSEDERVAADLVKHVTRKQYQGDEDKKTQNITINFVSFNGTNNPVQL